MFFFKSLIVFNSELFKIPCAFQVKLWETTVFMFDTNTGWIRILDLNQGVFTFEASRGHLMQRQRIPIPLDSDL